VAQGRRERKEENGGWDQLEAQGGWLLREVRRSGESKKYYIINTDPRVQWGPLGVCVERTTILQQPPSVDFPTTRASQPSFLLLFLRESFSSLSLSFSLLYQLFLSRPLVPVLSFEPFSRRGYLRNIYLDNLTRLIYRA